MQDKTTVFLIQRVTAFDGLSSQRGHGSSVSNNRFDAVTILHWMILDDAQTLAAQRSIPKADKK